VELLEVRCVPAIITVTTLFDFDPPPSAVSLRDAVQMANSDPGPDTIVFASGLTGTIGLTDPLMITNRLEHPGTSRTTAARSSSCPTAR
jgi:hypothetical protein